MAEPTTSTTPAAPADVPWPPAPSVPGASAELGELFAALAKAQGEIESATRSSTGIVGKDDSKRTFAYADLSSVWDACRAALSKAGLTVIQRPRVKDAWVTVETLLGHGSGQWIRSELLLFSCGPTGGADTRPRSIGATISFGRRYGLATLVGVVPSDEEPPAEPKPAGGQQQDQRQQQQRNQPRGKQQPAKPATNPATKPAAAGAQQTAKGEAFNPVTGEVLSPGSPDDLEQMQIALDECSTIDEMERWRARKDEMQQKGRLSADQLEQLRRAHAAKHRAISAA